MPSYPPSCEDLVAMLHARDPADQLRAATALNTLPLTPHSWAIAIGAFPRLVELVKTPRSPESVYLQLGMQAYTALLHISQVRQE